MPGITPRNAVVTGGASGLGRALCLELAAVGARTLVVDLNQAGAEETVALVREAGGHAEATTADVTDIAAMQALAAEAEARLGPIDFLANNAGVVASGAMGELPIEDWNWVLAVNLHGVINGCHAFVPKMKAARRGAILNTASLAGLLAVPELGPYNVSKAGVVALSETMYAELKSFDVGVTVLCPSFFKTNLLATHRSTSAGAGQAAQRAFDRARLTARDVAKRALSAVRLGQLYCLPMAEGRVAWWTKRLSPSGLARILGSKWVRDAYERSLEREVPRQS